MSMYQEALEYLTPLVKHPTLTGKYCEHLETAIEALQKAETAESSLLALEMWVGEARETIESFVADHEAGRWVTIEGLLRLLNRAPSTANTEKAGRVVVNPKDALQGGVIDG